MTRFTQPPSWLRFRRAGTISLLTVLLLSLGQGCASSGARPNVPAVTESLESRLAGRLAAVLDQAVRDSAFPGAVAVVGDRDGVLAMYRAGQLDRADPRRPDEQTLWDMASLTKVIVTTTALMMLVDEGRVVLDAPAVRYLPEWTADGARHVTVRQLLTHSAGLPAWRPLYRETGDAESARRLVLETGPDTVRTARYVYSDIGFILLGMLIERVTGDSLHAVATARLFRPLGMSSTGFRPDSSTRWRTAPTEHDPFRRRQLRAEVHDENAYRLDGVAGHAGLFSTAGDVARFAMLMLRGGEFEGHRLLSAEVIAQFAAWQDTSISHRALGWEKATGTNSGGRLLSPRAYGHTGFTGTSLWIDPAQDLFVILLTNRVNPTRDNRKISGVRQELADSVFSVRQATSSRSFLDGSGSRR